MKRTLLCLIVLAAAAPLAAQDAPLTVTVYNQNLGIVKEIRTLELGKGLTDVRIEDVPSQIDATSVKFRSLRDPKDTSVVEQNYEYDLANEGKLLEKFLDQTIAVITEDGKMYTGRLVSGPQNGNLILQSEAGEVAIVQRDKIRDIQLPELPGGLLTRPALAWKIWSQTPGEHDCQVMYMTSGMSWKADYTIIIPEKDSKTVDLSGWVTINNNSGKTYPEAKIKLIAGDVHRVEPPRMKHERAVSMMAMADMAPPEVSQRELFEYHLYELGHRTSLKENQTKQVEFITAANVPAEKFYVYDGVGQSFSWYSGNRESPDYGIPTKTDVQVYVEFMNDETSNLGKPLPAGTIRMFQKDEGEDFEFVGEDSINHTPKDERVRLRIGNAFDLVGERRQTDFTRPSTRSAEEEFEIVVRNHKSEPVPVRVVERLYRWSEWTMLSASDEYEKMDARTIEFRVMVPPGKEGKTIKYRVRYNW